ncbi:MAG: TIM barrel protein [Lapillicoccus sp.]
MRKSIATVSVSGTLEDKLEAIAAAHFAGIELFDADLTAAPMRAEEVAARCRDLGLAIDLFEPLRDVVGVSPAVFVDRLRFAEAKFEVMERLGATRTLLCSAVHPEASADLDLAAEQLAAVGRQAAERGFTLAYEALAWGTCINRVGQAWEVVSRAGMPEAGLAVDTFHLLARGDDAAALAGIPGDRVEYLQVADAPHLSMDVLEWSRHHRCFPGQGSLDVVGVVAAVVAAGYRGPLSLEVFSDIVREAEPHETARDAMRSLLYLEEQLRRHWDGPASLGSANAPSAPRASGPRIRPLVELFDPPAEPGCPAAAFVEIATDPRSSAIPNLLTSLGFRVAEGDADRALTRYRNGGAQVVLNGASDLALRRATALPRPSVAAVGIRVDDPTRLFARAEALTWQPAARHGPAAAFTVTSPTGVAVQVVPAGAADAGGAEYPGSAANPPADGWVGIDHVGVAVDVDHSDAEVSFYRTLFGLQPGPVSEFFDPAGRLRSRVLLPRDGGVRVVLNIVVRAGHAPTGVNQVAFACTDLLDRVEELRRSGAPLLTFPDGYYDDLQARLGLDTELLDRLRRLGVLYDRDGDGELFHVYTPLVAGRFYVELLDRRGGYAGFGAANTPVRLAMQASAPWVGLS